MSDVISAQAATAGNFAVLVLENSRRGLRAVLEVPGADPALLARYRAELDGIAH